jgi:hypothetical protein
MAGTDSINDERIRGTITGYRLIVYNIEVTSCQMLALRYWLRPEPYDKKDREEIDQ